MQLRKEDIEPHKRPFEAIRRYSTEFNASVRFGSDLSEAIFEFFKSRSKPGAFNVGSLYKTIYYFDSEFWPVHIPIVYGSVSLDARQCLRKIPETIKDEIFSNKELAWDYMVFWADCVDYAFGVDDLSESTNLNPFGFELLQAADQELRGILTLIEDRRARGRAVLACRMAVELFFKSYLALKGALTKDEARRISHDLEKIFDRFLATSQYTNWASVRVLVQSFPPIHARYERVDFADRQLWKFVALAQSIGAVICREYTDRNVMSQILPKGYRG